LNSPLAAEAANEFAARVRREVGADTSRQVERTFQLALQRSPVPEERTACLRLVGRRSLPELCCALLNLNEFAYLD